MPDGDIIHPTLSPRYYSLYEQVCEGHSDEDALAREALRCLKKDVKDFGDGPIHLIEQEVAVFEHIATQLQQAEGVDWAQERRKIKELAQGADGEKRALAHVIKACEQQLRDLQIEQHYCIRSSHFLVDITRRYLLNIYDAHFAGKVEQSRQHYNQADRQYVLTRLADMRPSVIKGLEYLSEQIARRNDVQVLRLPPRPKHMRMIDLKTDLDRDLSELV
jgi:hypothetical protein